MPKPKQKPVDDEELELEDEEDEEDEDEEKVGTLSDDDDDDEEEETKVVGKKKGKKTGKGSGLVPREPTVVTKEIFKAQKPEVQKLLKQREKAQAAGDKSALRKIRSMLRKEGFRLSAINKEADE